MAWISNPFRKTRATRRQVKGWNVALTCVALAVPTAAYFTFLASQTENVPLGDDFVTLLPFLSSWHDTNSFAAKLALLWEQCFSHRIVGPRLASLLVYAVHGDLQFVWIKAIGWFGWFALLVSLVFSTRRLSHSPILGLSVALLLMQPQGVTNMLVAVQAIQYVGALLFAYWALHLCIGQSRVKFSAAILLAVGAMMSSANGLMAFPVAALLLWIRGQRKRALAFGLVGAGAWTVFFAGYHLDTHSISATEFIANVAVMLGGAAAMERYGIQVAVLAGGAIGIAAIWAVTRRRHWTVAPVTSAFLLYLLLSVAMAARARGGWTVSYMLQDRYRIFGILCAVLVVLVFTVTTNSPNRRIWTGAFFVLSAAFCAGSYIVAYPKVLLVGQQSRATAMNRQFGSFYLLPGGKNTWEAAAENTIRAEEAGIYRSPKLLSEADVRFIGGLRNRSVDNGVRFTAERSEGDQGYVLRPDPVVDEGIQPSEIVVANFPDGPRVLAVGRIRLPLPQIINHGQVLSNHFVCIVPFAIYRSGPILIHGLNRDARETLQVAWSATAECP